MNRVLAPEIKTNVTRAVPNRTMLPNAEVNDYGLIRLHSNQGCAKAWLVNKFHVQTIYSVRGYNVSIHFAVM